MRARNHGNPLTDQSSSVTENQGQSLTVAAPITLADQLILRLAAGGIDTYFGVPGGAIEPLFNGLARQERRGGVRVVTTRSEAGAGFAADGFYRQSGRMAVCTSTTGPGISNLITAIMAAHADRIPMLVLTPQTPLFKQGRGALQDSSADAYDLTRMLKECTRYSSVVSHSEQLAHKLARALARALSAPMGPVHLSIPSDIFGGPPNPSLDGSTLPGGSRHSVVDLPALGELETRLSTATSPVFYIGDDAGADAACLCDIAREFRLPVVSSPAGKRWVDHFHVAYFGVLGFSGHERAKRAVQRAELIVTFGATFDELSTDSWTTMPGVPILSVDSHPEHAHRLPNIYPVISTTARAIESITDGLRKRERAMRSLAPPALSLVPPRFSEGPVHPGALMTWLGQELPEDVVVHIDTGNGFSWSTRDLKRKCPDTYRVAMGLGTMGWAIGAVIGATVARRRRSICVCGDGAMLMSSLELTVAVAENLPVTYLVLNDASLGMVRHGQRLAGSESIGNEIPPVRFDLLAQACGAKGVSVASMSELGAIPFAALGDDDAGPYVVDVSIDRDAQPPIAERIQSLRGSK